MKSKSFDIEQNALEVVDLGKSFPGVRALHNVNLSVRPGEVHALCGENGAGKSTLMKILAGNLRPDTGEIRHLGEPFAPRSPIEAKERGIVLVHQEISLVPDLTVAENLFLGNVPKTLGVFFNRPKLIRDAQELLNRCGYNLPATALAGELTIARQQMVEIARAYATKCSVVIFDEPTAALTDAEAQSLFDNIRRLKAQGTAIIYISHKMKEIFELSDRITVLRDGEAGGTLVTAETDEAEVMRLMIGRSLDRYFHRVEGKFGDVVLKVENLSVPHVSEGVSFEVRSGEILGLYGLVGAGRSEIVEALFGVRPRNGGRIWWQGRPVEINGVKDAVDLGIGLVPEDRKKQGLVLGLGGRDNISLPILDRLSQLSFMKKSAEEELYSHFCKRLRIKSSGPKTRVGTLSGGNQQKFVLAKWLATRPKLLILDEPTRGVDVGAKAEIHALIGELALQGLAVIIISSEMPEVMGVSHRILSLYAGGITGEFDGESVTENMLIEAVMRPSHRETQVGRA